MSDRLRIGILGAARISAKALLAPASTNSDVEVTTVAARDPQRAKEYAAKHGIPRVVASYAELLADPKIDAIYNPLLCSMWSSDVLKISARAVGEHGELSVVNPLTGHKLSMRTKEGKRVEHVSKRATYAYRLDAFAAAVLRGGPVLTPPADSIANMTVIDSIYTSAGLPIRQPM